WMAGACRERISGGHGSWRRSGRSALGRDSAPDRARRAVAVAGFCRTDCTGTGCRSPGRSLRDDVRFAHAALAGAAPRIALWADLFWRARLLPSPSFRLGRSLALQTETLPLLGRFLMAKVALSVLAHPDDAEFICAGSLIRLKREQGWT